MIQSIADYFYLVFHPQQLVRLFDELNELEEEADKLERLAHLHYELRIQAEEALALERYAKP